MTIAINIAVIAFLGVAVFGLYQYKARNRKWGLKIVVYPLVVLVVLGALGFLGLKSHLALERRRALKKVYRDALYVKVYDQGGDLEFTITDRKEILQLWSAMDIWNRKEAKPVGSQEREENPEIGRLVYGPDFGLESGDPFEFPITIFADGRAEWWGYSGGSWFWSTKLKDEAAALAQSKGKKAFQKVGTKREGEGDELDFFECVRADNLAGAKRLLEKDDELATVRDESQFTPLHYTRSEAMVELLVAHGADVNATGLGASE